MKFSTPRAKEYLQRRQSLPLNLSHFHITYETKNVQKVSFRLFCYCQSGKTLLSLKSVFWQSEVFSQIL